MLLHRGCRGREFKAMDSLQQNCPLPLHPFPPKNGGTGATPTRQKEQLSGYILILQDDYRKVTFLNCLTGVGFINYDLRTLGASAGHRRERAVTAMAGFDMFLTI